MNLIYMDKVFTIVELCKKLLSWRRKGNADRERFSDQLIILIRIWCGVQFEFDTGLLDWN